MIEHKQTPLQGLLPNFISALFVFSPQLWDKIWEEAWEQG